MSNHSGENDFHIHNHVILIKIICNSNSVSFSIKEAKAHLKN